MISFSFIRLNQDIISLSHAYHLFKPGKIFF
jgi:hypothetical protein